MARPKKPTTVHPQLTRRWNDHPAEIKGKPADRSDMTAHRLAQEMGIWNYKAI